MLVSEIFNSIQGESTYAGLPCVFIRLAGCNLSCSWCDTQYARVTDNAMELGVDEIAARAAAYNCRLVEITGGEPLSQPETIELADKLIAMGFTVLIETNGSVPLSGLNKRAVKIVDVKCPGSGQCGSFLLENIGELSADDEIKFVISNIEDYEFAKKFIAEFIRDRVHKILFAPVMPDLAPAELSEWILRDALRVRLNLQIHRYIWGDVKGR